MKEVFTTPMSFNTETLANRKEKAKSSYLEGSFCKLSRDFKYPATELHSFNSLEALCDFVADKTLNGQVRFPGYLMRQGVAYYDLRIMKPKDQIESELTIIFAEVEAEYKAEIEADVKAKTELLAQQLYEQAQAKTRKAEEDKERKAREAAMKDAQDYVASLANQKQ